MRGIDTEVRKSRKRIFKEVAKLAYDSENLIDDMEALPYKIVDNIDPDSADDVYRDRAIARERIRLAMGMSLRPENAPVHVSEGVEESNIAEKYYEPPLMQVIPSASIITGISAFCTTNRSISLVSFVTPMPQPITIAFAFFIASSRASLLLS